ncbi:Ammonium transporter Rh type C [Tetrabaena socialis]|uniref:Ammonium transporter Rh type C n=1 Tax=Tetrabaena socialis TaxID=47790 RepID=A0A2J8A8R3_9CHLO|nr:Ammonium transporter Rh type C [Tetrabaena socialis]|eukprot:PNH08853.1 Ammonium transporter Rh type C [Tetrabaena socialis]
MSGGAGTKTAIILPILLQKDFESEKLRRSNLSSSHNRMFWLANRPSNRGFLENLAHDMDFAGTLVRTHEGQDPTDRNTWLHHWPTSAVRLECALCHHNPSRRCTVNFDRKYLVNDVLKARCGAGIRVELIDPQTGQPVEDQLPEMTLQLQQQRQEKEWQRQKEQQLLLRRALTRVLAGALHESSLLEHWARYPVTRGEEGGDHQENDGSFLLRSGALNPALGFLAATHARGGVAMAAAAGGAAASQQPTPLVYCGGLGRQAGGTQVKIEAAEGAALGAVGRPAAVGSTHAGGGPRRRLPELPLLQRLQLAPSSAGAPAGSSGEGGGGGGRSSGPGHSYDSAGADSRSGDSGRDSDHSATDSSGSSGDGNSDSSGDGDSGCSGSRGSDSSGGGDSGSRGSRGSGSSGDGDGGSGEGASSDDEDGSGEGDSGGGEDGSGKGRRTLQAAIRSGAQQAVPLYRRVPYGGQLQPYSVELRHSKGRVGFTGAATLLQAMRLRPGSGVRLAVLGDGRAVMEEVLAAEAAAADPMAFTFKGSFARGPPVLVPIAIVRALLGLAATERGSGAGLSVRVEHEGGALGGVRLCGGATRQNRRWRLLGLRPWLRSVGAVPGDTLRLAREVAPGGEPEQAAAAGSGGDGGAEAIVRPRPGAAAAALDLPPAAAAAIAQADGGGGGDGSGGGAGGGAGDGGQTGGGARSGGGGAHGATAVAGGAGSSGCVVTGRVTAAAPAASICCLYGSVPPEAGLLPPLQPGELRLCGLTFHPDLAPAVRRAMARWEATALERLRAEGLGGELADLEPESEQMEIRDAEALSRHGLSSTVICTRLARLLGLVGQASSRSDAPLPEGPLGLAVEARLRRCADSARGGWGLAAGAAVRRNAVLGVVGGYVMPGGAAARRFVASGHRHLQEGVRAELARAVAGTTADVSTAWRLLAGSYCMPYQEGPAAAAAAAGVAGPSAPAAVLCMLGYGNAAALVNDPRAQPKAWVEGSDVDDEEAARRANCVVLPVAVRGVVLPVLVAVRDIAPGEQLLRDYGAGWWRGLAGAWEPGELRLCGLTFHPDLAPAVRRAMARWEATALERLRAEGLDGRLANEVPDTVQVSIREPEALSRHGLSSTVICARVARLLRLVGEGGRSDAPLPEGPLGLAAEARLWRCAEPARGGCGLAAGAAVRRNAVLGVVGGYVMPAVAAEGFVAAGYRHCRPDVRAELDRAVGGTTADVSTAWRLLAGSYCMPYPEGLPAGRPSPSPAALCMLGWGNAAALINDPRAQPRAWVEGNDAEEAAAAEAASAANCALGAQQLPGLATAAAVVPVVVRGMVLPVLVAVRDIAPGEQLLRDYGAGWWRGLAGAWEVPLYTANQYFVFDKFKALDIGGSISIHAFGAYYGLAVSRWIATAPGGGTGHPKNGATPATDVTAMIGTLFLWILWPSDRLLHREV